jgi:NAD(P)-dependent dehydrogenase (short-subunit alcohol dehydrogenase family)
MSKRRFSLSDQNAFAAFSGDYNPLHVDPLAARRLVFGEPVVHGMHLLLWTLDTWLGTPGQTAPGPVALRSLAAKFRKPLGIDRDVELAFAASDTGNVRAKLTQGDDVLATIDFTWGAAEDESPQRFAPPGRAACRELDAQGVPDAAGSLPLEVDAAPAMQLFPHAALRLSPRQVAQLAATSRLVGMECPGLHSVYGELNADFSAATAGDPRLDYKVLEYDDRYRSLQIGIDSPGMSGTIQAFLRPQPIEQPGVGALKGIVPRNAFAAQRALVVGGSRGLGEVTAKLLAVGGADLRLTYCRGRTEAESIVQEILAECGRAAAFAYDVLDPGGALAHGMGAAWQPTHLYYFATPHIAAGSPRSFSRPIFQRLSDYYVGGFADTVLAARAASPGLRGVFYPSTIYLDQLPKAMPEYVAAKAAGEAVCDYFRKHLRGVVIHAARLPRMSTDQTASLLPAENHDAAEVMLPALLDFSRQATLVG